ncbi:phage terminase large subunit family protein [Herbaspirillum sp. DW155]|nr:phage terminase large subunit family protein [Herbaspirillum sp. DW155]
MLAVTEPGVHIITAMVSTQLLKTALLENVFGFFAHLDPCPMLLLQPKEEAAQQFAKERIAPYIRVTPVLRALVGTSKTRNKDETLLYKAFPGGFLALAGAGSPDNLARRPIRVLLSDEVDKYPVTREGDPIALAEERTATFGVNWLSIRACSPTIEDESRIEASYKDSDMRRASLECPHCGHRMFPDFFKHVHWDKRLDDAGNVVEHLPKTARIYCECCGVQWSEGDRLKALKTARWHQTKPFDCCGARHVPLMAYDQRWNEKDEGSVDAVWDWWTSERHAVYRAKCPDCGATPVDNSHAGFQASKLYSPWQKDKPADIAGKWLKAKGDPDREQAWWNTQMGLPHRPHSGKELQLEALVARGEIWPAAVPDGVGVVTAGVDVQDYRVEVETVGWGRNEESWSIDTHVIDGEFSDPKVQEQLDAYLAQIWRRVDRRGFEVMAACIDSGGHHTEAVYQFCKARLGRRIWAVKGESARNGARNPVWPTKRPSSRNKSTFRPVILGVNAAKDTIRNRLHLENVGPGYMHFPHDRDIGYFAQLTSERSVVKVQSGQKFRVWELPNGKANEALDMRVYAYAALCGLMHIGLKLNKRVDALLAPPPAEEAAPMPAEVPQAATASVVQVAQSTRKSLAARLA